MHPVRETASIKIVLKIVCLETLITGIRSLENESRKDASERVCKECAMNDEIQKLKDLGDLALLIPNSSHDGPALTVFDFRPRNVRHNVWWSEFCHWLVPDKVDNA